MRISDGVQTCALPILQAPSRLAPLIDPRFHSCGTVTPHGHRDLAHPEAGFYVVGMKSYGTDRKSVVSGKSVSVRVDIGGRRILKKKTTYQHEVMAGIECHVVVQSDYKHTVTTK